MGINKTLPNPPFKITLQLAKKLIRTQFPEFAYLPIQSVQIQGHDNRTFRLGENLLIRMPISHEYALKVSKEQSLLPYLATHLSIPIPEPVKLGKPSDDYPFHFSIYKWLEGESANNIKIDDKNMEHIAKDLAKFLKQLQSINSQKGLMPGLHNWWRGSHVSVYEQQFFTQITELKNIIEHHHALALWKKARDTQWQKSPVWIHGDFAKGNVLIQNNKLTGIIDFGGMGIGDPACDLTIAWTFLEGTAKILFKQILALDEQTWLRAKAWAL